MGNWRHSSRSTEENRKAGVAEKAVFIFEKSRFRQCYLYYSFLGLCPYWSPPPPVCYVIYEQPSTRSRTWKLYNWGAMTQWAHPIILFYAFWPCKIQWVNCQFNNKEKCNTFNLLGYSVLRYKILWSLWCKNLEKTESRNRHAKVLLIPQLSVT